MDSKIQDAAFRIDETAYHFQNLMFLFSRIVLMHPDGSVSSGGKHQACLELNLVGFVSIVFQLLLGGIDVEQR